MFNELYGLVNRNIQFRIEADRNIPETKRGALIAETTTGIMHVLKGLNSLQMNNPPLNYSFDEQFRILSEHQLQWRFMLHLGLDERESGRIIRDILPLLTPALRKHYRENPAGLYS